VENIGQTPYEEVNEPTTDEEVRKEQQREQDRREWERAIAYLAHFGS
jgi:hypothetical protein